MGILIEIDRQILDELWETAVRQEQQCIDRDYQHYFKNMNPQKGVEVKFLGKCGEYAVAEALGMIGSGWPKRDMGFKEADIGQKIAVRTTEHSTGHLLIYERDDWSGKTYVLVTGKPPRMTIQGSVKANDVCESREFYRSDGDLGCWWVPQSALTAWTEDLVQRWKTRRSLLLLRSSDVVVAPMIPKLKNNTQSQQQVGRGRG